VNTNFSFTHLPDRQPRKPFSSFGAVLPVQLGGAFTKLQLFWVSILKRVSGVNLAVVPSLSPTFVVNRDMPPLNGLSRAKAKSLQ
jgi:hypothetical protein